MQAAGIARQTILASTFGSTEFLLLKSVLNVYPLTTQLRANAGLLLQSSDGGPVA